MFLNNISLSKLIIKIKLAIKIKITTKIEGNLEKLKEMADEEINTLVLLRAKPPFQLKDGFYRIDDIDFEFYNDPQGLLVIVLQKILADDPENTIPKFMINSLNEVCSKSGVPKEQHLKWPIPFQISVLWNSKDGNVARAEIVPS